MKKTNWILKSSGEEIAKEISLKMNVSMTCSKLLVNRGISSAKEAKIFLYPELEELTNPFLLPDIEKAVRRIRASLDKKEKILVYGDSDVDGITAVCILWSTIRSLGGDASWYVPSDEGYGLKKEIIDGYFDEGTKLIITVDCGISAFEEISYAKKKGIEVIVCDHHEVHSSGIPDAFAVVDPKRPDSVYPFNELAGCAVAFKLAEALMLSYGKYYGKTLVFFDISRETLSATKVLNGIVLENMTALIDKDHRKNARKSFSDFLERAVIVFSDRKKETIELEAFLGNSPDNEHVDTCELSEKYSDFKGALLEEVSRDGSLSESEKKYEVFRRLERIDDLRMKYFRESHLDVMALGTIADMVPLVKENRIIVKHGLRRLKTTKKKGLEVLIERSMKKSGNLSARSVSWDITPVLNAAGRLGKASVAEELLLCDDQRKSEKLLEEILKLNSERKSLQSEHSERLMPLLEDQCNVAEDPILILKDKNIEQGLLGLVASQIVRAQGKPAIVILIKENEAVGSCRSVPGLDIVSMLEKSADLLIKYGGHNQAAGLTIALEKIDEFCERIKHSVGDAFKNGSAAAELSIDTELSGKDISMDLVEEMSFLEPFGAGNPNPVFSVSGMRVSSCNTVGSHGNHLKLRVSAPEIATIDAVGWNLGHLARELQDSSSVDLAFNLEINTWQEKSNLQMKIVDIRTNGRI